MGMNLSISVFYLLKKEKQRNMNMKLNIIYSTRIYQLSMFTMQLERILDRQ